MATKNTGGRPATAGIGSKRAPTLTNLQPQQKQGRPRAAGTIPCDRCKKLVPRIRVKWPDGRVCGICFYDAVHSYGTCFGCGGHRLTPGLDKNGKKTCVDCAGITTNVTCGKCGREAERFRGGHCIRCVVEADLEAILHPHSPEPDLRLKRLIVVLRDAPRPESIYTWMRGKAAHQLLASIGSRDLALTHEAFDALGASNSVEHLRAILVHNAMLPERGQEPFVRFERSVEDRLASFDDLPQAQTALEQFIRWRHLSRIRKDLDNPGARINAKVASAKQEITEAGKFLRWLHDAHHTEANKYTQAQVDTYLAEGTTTRTLIRNFLAWDQRGTPKAHRPTAPFREPHSTPMLTQRQRIELVRNCLTMEQVATSTRLIALILLLWAHPLTKIATLTLADLEVRSAEGMFIRLGREQSIVPEGAAALFNQHLGTRGTRTVNSTTSWLFPGTRAGAHIHPGTITERLNVLGVDGIRARNSTLQNLVREVDARTLIDLLGYSPKTVTEHAARAGTTFAGYIDLRNDRLF